MLINRTPATTKVVAMIFCIRLPILISSLEKFGKKSERMIPKKRTKNEVVLEIACTTARGARRSV
jgi:hypothetical protein